MMEPETLIQQLVHAMSATLDRAVLERLASEYATQCHAANRRLEQCLAVLQHGNSIGAIHLAEASPSVLDLVAVLSFDRSEEWRRFCQAQRIPEAERLNERALSRLNEAYNNGISPQHPLYRQYREAMANRDEMRALTLIRALHLEAPDDSSVRDEVRRLEKKLQPAGPATPLTNIAATSSPSPAPITTPATTPLPTRSSPPLPTAPLPSRPSTCPAPVSLFANTHRAAPARWCHCRPWLWVLFFLFVAILLGWLLGDVIWDVGKHSPDMPRE